MIPAINASKVYSILGNNDSLVPLAMKDIANSMGLTAGSYITGDSVEGKDRFIDEFGTQAIWLFGIPVYKKVLDLTLFKSLGYDAKVDARLLKNQEILKKAQEFAPTQAIKNSIANVAKNQKTYKGLTIAKFVASTLLTMGTYFGLTKFRHKYTEDQIKKDYFEKNIVNKEKFNFTSSVPFSSAFNEVHQQKNKSKQPSFTGGWQEFMFNPVKNLMIVDATISGERLAHARNKQDFVGYAVKEGSFWAFMYFAGKKIQSALENSAEKKHNKSIDLDARVIESDELKEVFANKSILKDLQDFPIKGSDAEIYEFINKNPDNFVVQMAKKSDIITTMESNDGWFNKLMKKLNLPHKVIADKDAIDTRRFIDIADVKGVATKLEKLHNQFESSGETLETFLKGVKKLKRSAIRTNIGSCIAALGVVAPTIMVALRLLDKDNKEFQTKKDIEAKLAAAQN